MICTVTSDSPCASEGLIPKTLNCNCESNPNICFMNAITVSSEGRESPEGPSLDFAACGAGLVVFFVDVDCCATTHPVRSRTTVRLMSLRCMHSFQFGEI